MCCICNFDHKMSRNISVKSVDNRVNSLNEIASVSFGILFDADKCDPRTRHFWLVSGGPWKVIVILLIYYAFVRIIGPKLMQNRRPFNLRNVLLIYNVSLILINSFFFYEAINAFTYYRSLFDTKYPPDDDFSRETIRRITAIYWYCISKFVDLTETVFFVLRKKNNQISFLHMYHHISVPLLAYISLAAKPNIPGVYLFILCNSFVHIVMYTYYALASFGQHMAKYLWWKKYITRLQLMQFVVYILYTIYLAKHQVGYPDGLFWYGCTQSPIFFFLFFNFYKKSYQMKHKNL